VAADGYYSGRPLGLEYDPQQAQAVPAPPLQAAQPQATAGEQANGVPAPQPQQPRQDVGEQVANHTHVHGVPGVCQTDPNFSSQISLLIPRLAFSFKVLFDASSVCLYAVSSALFDSFDLVYEQDTIKPALATRTLL